jgi:hypothetical protein
MAWLLLIVFPVLVWWGPGYLASRWALPHASPLARLATSHAFGMALVVPVCFAWGFLRREPLTPELLVVVALGFCAAFGGLIWWRLRSRASLVVQSDPASEPMPARGRGAVAAVLVLAATFSVAEAPRATEATELWAPCPHQSSFYLLEDGRGHGIEAWDASWDQRVSHLVQHALEPGFGMKKVLTYQRVGSTATLVQPVAFFGSGGFVVATFVYYLLVLSFGALLVADRLPTTSSGWQRRLLNVLPVAIALGFLIGVRAIATYTVNENVLALGLSMATLWLLLRRPGAALSALAGVVFALCLATRPMCIGLVPAVIWYLWPVRRTAWAFFAAVPVALTAFLIAHFQLFGVAVTDPSLFQVRTVHHLFGFEFTFHPLIWPFSDAVYRSANEPFPLLFQIPLEHLRAFGGVFFALVAVGAATTGWRRALPAFLWGLPGYALMCALVSLDHHKQSYALTAVGALPLLAGEGLSGLFTPAWRRRFVSIGGALALLLLVPLALRLAEFPADPRLQYNDEVGRWDDPPVHEKRDRLLRPTLAPRFESDVSTIGLALELLSHGRPPQRSDAALESPVFVWKQLHEITHDFSAVPSETPRFPPYIGDLEGGLELTDSTAMISLEVPAGGPSTVRLESDGHSLRVAVTTAGSGAPGYLSIGYIDDGIETLQSVTVTVDGAPADLRFHVLERAGQAPQLRIVANHPIRLVPVSHGLTLGFAYEAAEPERRPCGDYTVGEYAFHMDDDAVLVRAGPYDLRLRTSRGLRPPPNRCAATRIESDPP